MAKRGAIAGGLVGLIFPPSIIVGAAVGAAGGGVWGKIRDEGFKDEDLKAVGESLEPGTSAIIAIAEDRVVERLETGRAGYNRIARHALSAGCGRHDCGRNRNRNRNRRRTRVTTGTGWLGVQLI